MCPKPNETENLLSKKSHVEELTEKVAGLFKVLTEEPDHLNRWTSITFPVDFNFTHIGVKKETKLLLRKYFKKVNGFSSWDISHFYTSV